MPYPSRIDRELILQTARDMVELDGVDQLSLHKIAGQLGVKTPSLYRYIKNRNDLLKALIEHTRFGLVEALYEPLKSDQPGIERMFAVGSAYRAYAFANPITYGLSFTNTIPELRSNEEQDEQAVLPIQAAMAEIAGEEQSLTALRGLMALVHGWIMLELSQQFRRGGDLEEAFEQALRQYLAGWQQ